jgi:opacity protein-like surface antigen
VGSVFFNVNDPTYTHDTRSVWAPGAGFEYKIVRHISIRAEYEKQYWQRLFQMHQVANPTGILIEPRGVTLGATYSFEHLQFGGHAKKD